MSPPRPLRQGKVVVMMMMMMMSIQEDRVLYSWAGGSTRAGCCIMSASAFLGGEEQVRTQGSQQGEEGSRSAVPLRGNMESAVHPHLVHHGRQEGALTHAGM
ncbi:hypothetical protein OYC64_000050 [Pagothenia borchgrevinki]|uniref:Uncharacterized protein n=1 Tax=Pagothenia borchgrevinki TaxID=8213 RepID=A0ABD2HAX7_PAGBO